MIAEWHKNTMIGVHLDTSSEPTLHRPHAEHKAGHSYTVKTPGVAFFVVINLKLHIIFNPVSLVSLNNYFSGNLEL